MSHDINTIDPEKVSDITQNAYYKKLQKELKDRTSVAKGNDDDPSKKDEIEKAKKPDIIVAASKAMAIEDTVSIKSFEWKKNKNGSFLQKTNKTGTTLSSIDLTHDGSAILRILGKKIDLTSQAMQLRQQYMSNMVQSKSPNYMLAKYAEFKVSIIGQILTYLGSTPAELQLLKKKAISNAIEENIQLMGESIYNTELTLLIEGRTKKNRRTLQRFDYIKAQLIGQMKKFGREAYWTKSRLLEEEITQCKKLHEEFHQEYSYLKYQLDFFKQEV